ncbi:uncharacterized protein LOC130623692 [Hydractinia symbiolongicarpus]|uniref:uncharacterized protein LOC130623692 n=1 Tax=Hydractinia symbiolongicarpus TaxID=13093 RepID=UPI00254CB807|nr:uncharacterized protein LOC130623692 [Hydractinia symbiolongicarpus]
MFSINHKLLNYYKEHDENVTLVGNDFEVLIKLFVVRCFVPVMKTALETKINDADKKKRRHIVLCGDFDKFTVQLFVKILQDTEANVSLSWSDIVGLINFCHYYHADEVIKICYSKGANRINKENIYEAIQLVETYSFRQWDESICYIIQQNRSIRKNTEWKYLFSECPNTMCDILNKLLDEKT